MHKKVLVVGLNPVMQKTIVLKQLLEDEVNRSNNYLFSVAGKGGNTARVLTELGSSIIHLTHGGGIFKDTFIAMLQKDNIPTEIVESHSEIRLCYTLLNQEKHTATEIVEEALPIDSKTDQRMRSAFLSLIDTVGVVAICGTKATGYSEDIIPWMAKISNERGKKVVMDVKGKDLLHSIEYNPTVIKPNLKEFIDTFFPVTTDIPDYEQTSLLSAVKSRMIELEQQHRIVTVLTRGSRPVLYCYEGVVKEYSVESVVPINTIGSGDAFTAGIAYGLSELCSITDCVRIGVACGKANALNVQPGTIKGYQIPR